MKLGEKIQYLRKQSGLSQKELAEKLDIATGSLQQYELNKREPKLSMLNKIAKILKMPMSVLISDDLSFHELEEKSETQCNYIQCSFCGYNFYPLNKYQVREHNIYHKKFERIKEKFGDIMNYEEAENLRIESINIMNSSLSNNNDILTATENCLKAEFSESVRLSGLDINHIDYCSFCHLQLEQQWALEVLPEDVYHELKEKYSNIPDECYLVCCRKEDPLKGYSDPWPVQRIMELYPQLNRQGRKEAAKLIELLVKIPEYITEEEKEIRKMCE